MNNMNINTTTDAVNEEMLVEVRKASDYTDSHADAIEVLTNAFRDYKNSVDERIDSIKNDSARMQVNKGYPQPEAMPVKSGNSHLMDYITKGAAGFSVQGGYAVIPEIDFVSAPEHASLIRLLASTIKQSGGMEHDLLRVSEKAFIKYPEDEKVPMVEPTSIKVNLHRLELGMFLRSTLTSNVPANFESMVKSQLYKSFAKYENEYFLSNDGIEGKIKGIGNLSNAEGFKTVGMDYDGQANELYNRLFRMISMMSGEYMENAVWLMSSSMFTAIAGIRDIQGRFIGSYDYKNPTLLGFPVHCNDHFNSTEHQIILANLKEGYTLVEYPNILALHDNYKNREGVTNYFTKLMAGAITNKEPWVSLRINKLPQEGVHFAFQSSGE